MEWILVAIASLMAIGMLTVYFRQRQIGYLFRGLAWVGFAVYLAFYAYDINLTWLLYLAIALFVIGMFSRAWGRPEMRARTSATDEHLPPTTPAIERIDEDEKSG